MKIFVDENIPVITVKELREKGFDVKDIRGTADQGIPAKRLGSSETITGFSKSSLG